MKNVILIIGLSLCSFISKAQVEYDTVIYIPPSVTNCTMYPDTTYSSPIHPATFMTRIDEYLLCGGNPNYANNYNVLGNIVGSNSYEVEAIAQQFHLDSTVIICGVRARVWGNTSMGLVGTSFFSLMDSSGVLAYKLMETSNGAYKNYYFNQHAQAKDFFIVVDFPPLKAYECEYPGSPWQFAHTCSIVSNCLGLDIGCYTGESPLFLKNNHWTSFDQDSVYYMYHKMFIEWLPILLIPKADTTIITDTITDTINNLTQLRLETTISIYPNPAKNELFIQSDFKVITLEIYNNLGVKVKEMELNRHEAKIDIANLPSGNYTLKLLTTQGEIKKKFVIK